MDKQREEFEKHYIENLHDGDIHPNQQLLEWSEKGEFYFASSVDELWDFWQQAQKVAVPDTTAIVLALENVQTEVSQSSFVTMDADNESEIYAVDANKLSKYIDDLIESQEN